MQFATIESLGCNVRYLLDAVAAGADAPGPLVGAMKGPRCRSSPGWKGEKSSHASLQHVQWNGDSRRSAKAFRGPINLISGRWPGVSRTRTIADDVCLRMNKLVEISKHLKH